MANMAFLMRNSRGRGYGLGMALAEGWRDIGKDGRRARLRADADKDRGGGSGGSGGRWQCELAAGVKLVVLETREARVIWY